MIVFENWLNGEEAENTPSPADMDPAEPALSSTPSRLESDLILVTIVTTVPPLQSTGSQQTRFSPFSSWERIRNTIEIPKPLPTPEFPSGNRYTTKCLTEGTQN